MDNGIDMAHVFTAADPAEAQAIIYALIRAGIDGRVVAGDDGGGPFALEIFVPAADADEAIRIIRAGNWPRLA